MKELLDKRNEADGGCWICVNLEGRHRIVRKQRLMSEKEWRERRVQLRKDGLLR